MGIRFGTKKKLPRKRKNRGARKQQGPSHLEQRFARAWKDLQGPAIEREYRFHPVRKWKFDFAHTATKVAIEIEGGIYQPQGRHTTGNGFRKDCEKYNEALFMGWRVIRLTSFDITPDMVARIISYIGTWDTPAFHIDG